ncbi:hypothetical protein E4P54_23630 [Salmonella enterica subsp. enterica serovar Panama]|uniref:hypothetical protein n=1 Tax=Enterobacteriaceae TaxID=543 RepID=UPI0014752946|nr:hypothetical protein [Salmonella enterica]EGC7113104.1 hypothetical protein [Salmonella enterica]EGN5360072.1 hypothetical protein [Salmonella enterica]EGO0260013.1 hypothetical protein [Salmonella enterica subsp. enterica serovar Panama]EGP7451737.1 hypothetical protein [Salmonella enterica subsp. enterica serovar Panama]NMF72063.1 hypothetical protein [Salmonella enterica subsp. enterica serovar Panama]
MKTKLLLALIAGSSFCINIAEANIPLRADGSPAAGQTPTQFIQLKNECPECVMVATDVVKMRSDSCKQQASIDSTILQDPVYAYLNSIRLVVAGDGGYASPIYTSARQVVAANINCSDANDWVARSKTVMDNTFKTP